jgi:hypothetical protein
VAAGVAAPGASQPHMFFQGGPEQS